MGALIALAITPLASCPAGAAPVELADSSESSTPIDPLAPEGEELRCTGCGLPIEGRYIRISGENGAWCGRCADESKSCALCGVPARNPSIRDGRILCEECVHHLVEDVATFERLFADMVLRLERVLDRPLHKLPELVIVPIDDVDRRGLTGPVPFEKLGGLFTREADGRTRIQLVSPLTEPRARAVLAHELAHAWQAEHCPESQGLRIREGFAEWVSWGALEGIDSCEKERAKIEMRTDDYGRGFQVFRTMEERDGKAAALRYARSARQSMPSSKSSS